jgi:hypothetical protein
MFVQSFQSGSFAPKEGSSEIYTLTLNQGLGQTIYFSDRPDRVFGAAPTPTFLKNFPFGEKNPPNAALVLEAGPGDTDVVVVELSAPQYDEGTHTATYEATVLSDYEKLGATFQETPKGAGQVHPQFGAAHLFIDDCPDLTTCEGIRVDSPIPGGSVGQCWHWDCFCCLPCNGSQPSDYDALCNRTYPLCSNQCYAEP